MSGHEWVTEQLPAADLPDRWDSLVIVRTTPQVWYSQHVLPGSLWRALHRDHRSMRQFYPKRRARMAGK